MARLTIQQSFELAMQHHQAGRLGDAEQIYRQILVQQPQHVGAMQRLAVLAQQGGRRDLALDLFRRAIAVRPDYADAHNNLGNALRENGQFDEAIAACRRAIALKANYPEAYYNLGIALTEKGQVEEAIAAYRQAIALKPGFPDAHYNLGIVLRVKGQIDEAIAAYRQAIAMRPNFPQAYGNLGIALNEKGNLDEAVVAYRQAIALRPNDPETFYNLGTALTGKGRLDEAIAAYRKAIALRPNFPEAHSNLGIALVGKGRLDEAIAAYRQAIAIKPNYPEAHSNLGNALRDKGEPDPAIAACRQAIALRPDYAEAHSNLGNALSDKGQLDQAVAAYRQAIAFSPDYADAHRNLALILLLRCEFEPGWQEYEWRLKVHGKLLPGRASSGPLWDGGDLSGRTILLQAEQGLGDTIQFIRYVPLVIQRGGRVLVQSPKELIPLLRQLPGVERWLAAGQPLPPFDVRCPLPSLPRLFGTNLRNIPAQNQPLLPDPELAKAWRHRLQQQPPGLKVGLVWAGNPSHKNDRHRSIALCQLAPLGTVSGVCFYSLQKAQAAEQTAHPPAGMSIIDWSGELQDFADTAALVAHLDLIISVDTSVAHLAAAMGKPIWLLLPFLPDWRWMLDRDDSPWYPTMRLFRQQSRGNWDRVITRLVQALSKRLKARS